MVGTDGDAPSAIPRTLFARRTEQRDSERPPRRAMTGSVADSLEVAPSECARPGLGQTVGCDGGQLTRNPHNRLLGKGVGEAFPARGAELAQVPSHEQPGGRAGARQEIGPQHFEDCPQVVGREVAGSVGCREVEPALQRAAEPPGAVAVARHAPECASRRERKGGEMVKRGNAVGCPERRTLSLQAFQRRMASRATARTSATPPAARR